jgi:hypothetical protein
MTPQSREIGPEAISRGIAAVREAAPPLQGIIWLLPILPAPPVARVPAPARPGGTSGNQRLPNGWAAPPFPSPLTLAAGRTISGAGAAGGL